jgi:CBS domain-containing protein
MTNCPFCGAENIEGADQCQQCEQSLDFLSMPAPQSDVERGLLRDKVRLIASRRPVLAPPDRPVCEVIEQMVDESVGCVVVVSDSGGADSVCEKRACDTNVCDSRGAYFSGAYDGGGAVAGSSVAGIFSERDALVRLNVRAAELGHLPVSQFMTPTPETIEGDAEIAFALQKMDVGGYRHLPVIDHGQVVGVISIRDILQYVSVHLESVD